jgi:hypothetical protein
MKTIAVGVTDYAHFDQRVELEGVTYVLTFHWNARRNLWALDVALPGEDPAVAGISIVSNRLLLSRYHYRTGVPPGELVAIDPTLLLDGPRFDWSGFFLAYFSASEVASKVIE